MTRRRVALLLATAAAGVLLPATAADARCYPGDDVRAAVCNATCRVLTALELAYC